MVERAPLVLFFLATLAILQPVYGLGYATYHTYQSGDSLGTVACSDGANGIITKFGYSNISPMFPYVTAFSGASWNSPQCGRCIQLRNGGKTIYVTVIDQCGGPPQKYDAHFDIAPPAFNELFGQAGVRDGHGLPEWQFVDSSLCKGNRGNGGGDGGGGGDKTPEKPKKDDTTQDSGGGGGSTTRCGKNWENANSSCKKSCKDDSDCGSEKCFADLKLCKGGGNNVNNKPQQSKVSGGKVTCDHGSCDAGECCSKWGWCGTSSAHCGAGCKAGKCSGRSDANEAAEITETVHNELEDGKSGDGDSDDDDDFNSATTTDGASEENADNGANSESSSSIPAWAAGLIAIGSIMVVLLLATLVVVLRQKKSTESF